METFNVNIFLSSNKYIKLCFLFLLAYQVNAQQNMVEYNVKYGFSDTKLITLGTEGSVLFYKTTGESKQKSKLVFIKLDTTLNELWQNEFQLPSSLDYIKHCFDNQYLFILFTYESKYEIVQINVITGEVFSLKGNVPYKSCQIEDFNVIDNYAYWGGSIPPTDGKVFFRSALSFVFFPLMFIPNFMPEKSAFASQIDLNKGSSKEYAFNYKGYSTLTDIIKDTINGNNYFFIKNISGKNSSLYLQNIKSSGVRSKNISITPISKKHQLLTGKFYVSTTGKKMVIGTYGKGKNTGAQGLYFSGMDNGKQSFIEYYSFTKFKKFFNYLSINQRERIINKIENKKKSGKDLSLDYQLLIHDIVESNNTYKIVSEAYFPVYRTEFRTIWVYGRPVTQAYNVFDGWRYSHAIVACFNSEGKMMWDDWMPILNTTSYYLDEKVKINCNDNITSLVLYQDNKFIIKNIDENNIDKNLDILPENISSNEKLDFSSIEFWYGDYAILITTNRQVNDNDGENVYNKIKIKKYKYLNIK